jgi:hypothetical protein
MEGLGTPAPSTYLRAGLVQTFPQFPRIAIHGLYSGVDAIFYGSGEDLEYDLQLSSGKALDQIRMSVEGSNNVQIDSQGNLTIHTPSGTLHQMQPKAFQKGRAIEARYVLLSSNQVGLKLGKYDHRAPLTVDPLLTFTKSFGGSGSSLVNLVATDAQGNIYAAGSSSSVDFPTTSNSLQPSVAPNLRELSNAGQTIQPLRVGTVSSVGTVGATPDGKILYAATPGGILLSGDSGASWKPTSPLPIRTTASFAPSGAVNAFSIDSTRQPFWWRPPRVCSAPIAPGKPGVKGTPD